jgi:hypothetical protein
MTLLGVLLAPFIQDVTVAGSMKLVYLRMHGRYFEALFFDIVVRSYASSACTRCHSGRVDTARALEAGLRFGHHSRLEWTTKRGRQVNSWHKRIKSQAHLSEIVHGRSPKKIPDRHGAILGLPPKMPPPPQPLSWPPTLINRVSISSELKQLSVCTAPCQIM